jgi:hypothetical protein
MCERGEMAAQNPSKRRRPKAVPGMPPPGKAVPGEPAPARPGDDRRSGDRRYVWLLSLGMLLLVVASVTMVVTRDRRDTSAEASALAGSPSPGAAAPSVPTAAPTSAPASATPSPLPRSPTVSPSQSRRPNPPTGTGPNRTNCGEIPSACGYPDATNTGVPAGTSLTVINGKLLVTKSGTVIDRKDIRGCVELGSSASKVIIRRSKITCLTDPYAIRSFTTRPKGSELLVEDSEIDCGNRNAGGPSTESYILRRVEIRNCENGADVGSNVTVEESWIHHMYSGATGHADGLQFSGGSNIVVRHNTIYPGAYTNAAIITHRDGNSNVLIESNLLAGGGSYTLYCPMYSSNNLRVINNRFSTLFWPKGGQYGPWVYCDGIAEARGNVWDSNLTSLS